MTRRRNARYLTAASVMLAALTVAGCGGDESAAVCSSVDSLQTSIDDVTSVDLSQGALAELQDNLSQVQSDLTQVKDDAKDEFAPEIDALDQATTALTASLDEAVTTPSPQAITAVGTAIQGLGTSLSALQDAVTSTC